MPPWLGQNSCLMNDELIIELMISLGILSSLLTGVTLESLAR